MNINIDINIKASEDITNSLLTLAAVLHNAVPIFDKSTNRVEPKKELSINNKELQTPKEKVEILKQEVKEITLQEVRGTLGRLTKKGKGDEVKALIKKFDSTKLSDIPKKRYGEVLKEAESIN